MKILAKIYANERKHIEIFHDNKYMGKINGELEEIDFWHDATELKLTIVNEANDCLVAGFLCVDLIQKGD